MIEKLASKHNLSTEAVAHLAEAIQQGNGTQAQFNHPELGGMGQWQNGMTMIGDAFNAPLKARVTAVCDDLAVAYRQRRSPVFATTSTQTLQVTRWWSEELGDPSSVGAQNSMYYAIFPHKARLVVRYNGEIMTYDTGRYHLTGVSQQQSGTGATLAFTSTDGQHLSLSDFTLID
ncbi:MAG: hypothetical protein AAF846_29960 [Chloroflexota bacterium]